MSAPGQDGPTNQRSTTNPFGTVQGWSSWTGGDDLEQVPELQWPNSVPTYARMMNDAQTFSLTMSLLLPIRAWHWFLDPNGARPELVERISTRYNLPTDPDPAADFQRRRTQRRFSFAKHLEDALRAVYLGHYPFEQVGDIEMINDRLVWALRKLAPIPPKTIHEINLEDDGGIKNIKQLTASPSDPPIPINRMVWYVWDMEGSNWTGRSMLRSIYRNYLVKDRVLRVGAINIERAGGIPYIQAPEGASGSQIRALDELARRFRVGESAGSALPHGAQLKFASAAGGDGAVAYIKQQNEEMARAFLQMVNMLGQTNSGSRALGGTFNDIAHVAQFTIAKWFCDTFNEHVIEDDVEWNEGPEEDIVPLLRFNAGDADPLSGFRNALDQDDGIQTEDPEVRAMFTTGEPPKRSLRPKSRMTARRSTERDATGGEPVDAQSTSPLLLPARPLRRDPYDHEVRAAVDFSALDSQYNSALDLLLQEIRTVRTFQADEIAEQIVSAGGDLAQLAQITATAATDQVLAQRLLQVAALAAGQAVREARSQGAEVSPQDISELEESIKLRAEAVDALLRSEFTQSASRNAIRLTGGGLSSQEVAEQVKRDLLSMSGAYAKDVLGGSVQQSINAGRMVVYSNDQEPGDLYASELLDSNTCSHCIGVDGKQYPDVFAAMRDYPTGTYRECDGRERCRGTVIKVYQVDDAATVSSPLTEIPA